MTFDEMYLKHFPTISAYCYHRNGLNQYLAEEATAKAFDVLYKKWNTLRSHDEKTLKSWLLKAAENTMKEVGRKQPPPHEPLDAPWCQDLIEEQQCRNGTFYDSFMETQKFLDYINEIEKTLKPNAKALFHYIVVEQLSIEETAKEINLTENAVRIRWSRLSRKLKPFVKQLIDCKQNVNVRKK